MLLLILLHRCSGSSCGASWRIKHTGINTTVTARRGLWVVINNNNNNTSHRSPTRIILCCSAPIVLYIRHTFRDRFNYHCSQVYNMLLFSKDYALRRYIISFAASRHWSDGSERRRWLRARPVVFGKGEKTSFGFFFSTFLFINPTSTYIHS